MEKILIGKVVSAVGIKGEIKVYSYSDPDGYKKLKHVYLLKKQELTEYKIDKDRSVGNTEILKLNGVDDRNLAETLINSEVYIMEEDLRELPENTYFIRDLIGCKMVDYNSGKLLGEITDVYQNSAQDNYEVKTTDGKITYIPAVKEFIKEIDIKNREVRVTLIPGFIDDPVIIEDENK